LDARGFTHSGGDEERLLIDAGSINTSGYEEDTRSIIFAKASVFGTCIPHAFYTTILRRMSNKLLCLSCLAFDEQEIN
jgi:hypothetical protein